MCGCASCSLIASKQDNPPPTPPTPTPFPTARQATLGRLKGLALLGTYALCLVGYPIAHQFW